MKKMLPLLREFWSKRKSIFSDEASIEVLSNDRLQNYAVSQAHDTEKSILATRPQTLQEGFYESIEIMRGISSHLEQQSETQKKLIEAIPAALSSVNQSMQASQLSQKKLQEVLQGLGSSLNLISNTHTLGVSQIQTQLKLQSRWLIGTALLLILVSAVAIGVPIYFAKQINARFPMIEKQPHSSDILPFKEMPVNSLESPVVPVASITLPTSVGTQPPDTSKPVTNEVPSASISKSETSLSTESQDSSLDSQSDSPLDLTYTTPESSEADTTPTAPPVKKEPFI